MSFICLYLKTLDPFPLCFSHVSHRQTRPRHQSKMEDGIKNVCKKFRAHTLLIVFSFLLRCERGRERVKYKKNFSYFTFFLFLFLFCSSAQTGKTTCIPSQHTIPPYHANSHFYLGIVNLFFIPPNLSDILWSWCVLYN